jgi:hypothetical protein
MVWTYTTNATRVTVHRRIVRRANTVKRGSRAQTNLTQEEFVKTYLKEYLKKTKTISL